jgi:hypothetical protein
MWGESSIARRSIARRSIVIRQSEIVNPMNEPQRDIATDSPVNIWRNYFLIVGAALSTAGLGALLGFLLAWLVPDSIGLSATSANYWRDVRTSSFAGAMMGFVFGTIVMAYCIAVAVLAIWFRPRNIERHFERERFALERAERERLELELARRQPKIDDSLD